MHYTHIARGIGVLVLLTILIGCGPARRVRTLPEEAEPYVAKKIDMYESADSKALFAEEKGKFLKLARAFTGALKKKYHPRVTHDPRLDMVAYVQALAWGEDETSPALSLVQWTLWKLGIAGYLYSSPAWWAKYGKPKQRLTRVLRKTARKFKGEGERYTFGVARAHVGSEKWAMGLVLVEKAVAVYDIPKRYQPGDTFVLRGKVIVPHEGVWFYMQAAGPETLSMPVHVDDNGWFLIEVPVPEVPGRYFVEMDIRRRPDWVSSALHFPIYVGMDESETPDEMILNPPPNPTDRLQWGERLAQMLNEQREPYGLEPLRVNGRLSRLASIHAQRTSTSCCKPVVSLRRKLREKRIRTDRARQSWWTFEHVAEGAWRRLLSPDFRERILDDRYEMIGNGFDRIPNEYTRSWRAVQYVMTPARERRGLPVDAVRALSTKVDAYEDKATADLFAPLNPRLTGLAREYETKIRTATGAEVNYDPALDALALTYASLGDLDWSLQTAMLWKLGKAVKVDNFQRHVTRRTDASPYVALEIANDINEDEDDKKEHYSFGLARLPTKSGWFIETLIVVKRRIVFETPIAKHYSPGEEIVIKGRFLGEVKYPSLNIDVDASQVMEEDITLGDGGHFAIQLVAPQTKGRHFIEINSHPSSYDEKQKEFNFWQKSEMLIPIYVGEREPLEIDNRFINPKDDPLDQQDWSERIANAYNKARQEIGLAPLKRNALADVLVRDKLYQDDITFDAPSHNDISKNLRRNGGGTLILSHRVYPEWIDQMAEWNLTIPSMRAIILDKKTSMLAAGVNEDGDSYFEVFISAPAKGKPAREGRFKFSALEIDESWSGPRKGRLSPNEIDATIHKHRDEVDKCYVDEVDEDEKGKGAVTVEFVIDLTGDVVAASLESSTIEHTELEKCLIEELREWTFPTPLGESAVITSHSFKLGPSIRDRVEKMKKEKKKKKKK